MAIVGSGILLAISLENRDFVFGLYPGKVSFFMTGDVVGDVLCSGELDGTLAKV